MIKYTTDAKGAPAAVGPYSQAAQAGNFHYLSGQIPLNPESGTLVNGTIEDQAEQVMKNLQAVLHHLGLNFLNVIKTNISLTDMDDFKKVNAVYERWMGDSKPARACVAVSALPLGAEVEIEMIAVSE